MSNEHTKHGSSTDEGEREKFQRPERVVNTDRREQMTNALNGAILVIMLLFIGFPLYWTITSGFRPSEGLFTGLPALIPTSLTLENFVRLREQSNFVTWFENSVIVAVGAMIMTTLLATLGGYGLTLSRFRGKTTIARGTLFVYMFPPMLLGIPMYAIFYEYGLLNSHLALILAHTAISLPFCLWLMWQYFQTIPMAFEESAWISGASRLRALWDVVLPMALPGMIASLIFTFAITWNDYTFAVILMTDSAMFTLPVGIQQFVETTTVHWALINSAAVVVVAPAIITIIFLQRYILKGFSVTQ